MRSWGAGKGFTLNYSWPITHFYLGNQSFREHLTIFCRLLLNGESKLEQKKLQTERRCWPGKCIPLLKTMNGSWILESFHNHLVCQVKMKMQVQCDLFPYTALVFCFYHFCFLSVFVISLLINHIVVQIHLVEIHKKHCNNLQFRERSRFSTLSGPYIVGKSYMQS